MAESEEGMRNYIARFFDVSNNKVVNIRVKAESSFDAHTKASAIMRKRSTRTYYWVDTFPEEWI